MSKYKIPDAPSSIQKGVPLKNLLGKIAVEQLGENLKIAYPNFNYSEFVTTTLNELEPRGIKDRADHIARMTWQFLPQNYSQALSILLETLTPPLEKTEDNGVAPMFYMPHCSFIALYGLDPSYNQGRDPFDISMQAQYELTKRFTCEFSIRAFIQSDQKRTLGFLYTWMKDPNPHVRRLCSEGCRSRLPWASKLTKIAADPSPIITILDHLKDDPSLYVRRSVANNVGDIAKDHMDLALDLCEKWLDGASKELKWVIRHALRNPYKKGVERAIQLRQAAK